MPILHYRSGRPLNKMAVKQVRVAREKMLFDRAHGVRGKDEWTVH
jgi:hypothetical protein